MKKNAMLKIAAILMVAVLLTTCAISSTFAKYIDTGKSVASNTAHVAKWGIDISVEAPAADEVDGEGNIKLFLNAYDEGDDVVTVQGDSNAIVVAPGTSNASDAFAIKVTGKPEVSYKLSVTPVVTLAGWTTTEGYYCPLAITVDGDPIYGNDYADEANPLDAFATAVEAKIAEKLLGTGATLTGAVYSKTYAPNTEVPATARDGVAVSWAWAFDETGTNPAGIDNDLDTELGNSAAANTIAISFSVSAEQVGD